MIDDEGTEQAARFLRGFPEVADVPEFDDGRAFMPAGGSVPLWEFDTPAGTARMLTVGMNHAVFRVTDGKWTKPGGAGLFTFGLRPVVIEPRPGVPKPVLIERIDPATGATKVVAGYQGDARAQDCVATDVGECALPAGFLEGYRYRVTLRLRDSASMYLNGAVDTPVAYSEKVDGGHRLIIEGGASPVLGMAGWIPKSSIPPSLVNRVFASLGWNYNWDVNVDAASYKGLGRGGRDALEWLKQLLPYFGDRASYVVDAWYLENTSTLGEFTGACLNTGKGEVLGVVSSNATAYTGDPPRYNARTSSLEYEVAGPHYMPDGNSLSKGRYSINMNTNFVKCLLGVDKVPSAARLELIYPDGEASAATLAVKQDRNWLRLAYENFTFSNPTVSVTFPKTITCFRGKAKSAQARKFVAFECPTGWRPRR